MSDQPGVTFAAFVVSLGTTAAVHFGDLPDPQTGERHVNLEGAGQMIEILAMLEEKTRGNLSDDERQLVDELLFDLRMRFVEARRAGGGPDAGPRIITP